MNRPLGTSRLSPLPTICNYEMSWVGRKLKQASIDSVILGLGSGWAQ